MKKDSYLKPMREELADGGGGGRKVYGDSGRLIFLTSSRKHMMQPSFEHPSSFTCALLRFGCFLHPNAGTYFGSSCHEMFLTWVFNVSLISERLRNRGLS